MSVDPIHIQICRSCSHQDLSILHAVIADGGLAAPVLISDQDCMNGCARPVSLALQSRGRATCFFGGVDLQADAADIVETVRAYHAAPKGWIEDARRCGRLRFCLVGRVPAL